MCKVNRCNAIAVQYLASRMMWQLRNKFPPDFITACFSGGISLALLILLQRKDWKDRGVYLIHSQILQNAVCNVYARARSKKLEAIQLSITRICSNALRNIHFVATNVNTKNVREMPWGISNIQSVILSTGLHCSKA